MTSPEEEPQPGDPDPVLVFLRYTKHRRFDVRRYPKTD